MQLFRRFGRLFMNHVARPLGLAVLTAGTLAAASPSAHAQFLIDPTGGTVLSTAGDDDTVYAGRALGFTGSFFGTPHMTVDVCSNGHINFSGDNSLGGNLNEATARISVMWDDLFVYAGQTITEKVNPGVYYSVTWKVGTFNFGHVYHEMQIVWFGAPVTLFGLPFQANDIALCYQTVGAPPWDAAIGLSKGDGSFVALPGDADGFITDAGTPLLPIFGTTGHVILFRPGAGTYHAINFPCPGDFNKNGVGSVQDIFDFLAAYFTGCP